MAACFCQGRVPECAPGGAVTCLLRRQGPVTKEKATPLSVSPSLRYGATCGARFRRGPRKLAWRLKQRAALIRLKLCSSARPEGMGAKQPFGPSLRSAPASAPYARRQRGRIQSRAGIGGSVQLSDHDFVQRNSCSDPNPGMMGATDVFCFSCLKQRDNVSDDSRLLSARSRRWRYQDTSTQR